MTPISLARMNDIFDRADSTKIAVLGDLMLDIYVSGTASRLSQEAPVPVLHVRKTAERLGGAANVMRNLSALSKCAVSAFGVVGNDDAGATLTRMLTEGGVDASGILSDPERRTTRKQRVLAGNQQLVRMDYEDTHPVSPTIIGRLTKAIKRKIEAHELDAIILEDYAKGLLERDMLQDIADTAVRHGVFISLDPHPGHNMQVRNLSLMTPNRMEAFGLAGVYCQDPSPNVEEDTALAEVATRIFDAWAPESLLITLGHQGMALFERANPGAVLAIPTVAREVFDVSGAGDTVIATYTLCKAAGASSAEAALLSNQAAGIVVGKAGTATTDRAELAEQFTS